MDVFSSLSWQVQHTGPLMAVGASYYHGWVLEHAGYDIYRQVPGAGFLASELNIRIMTSSSTRRNGQGVAQIMDNLEISHMFLAESPGIAFLLCQHTQSKTSCLQHARIWSTIHHVIIEKPCMVWLLGPAWFQNAF